MEEFLHGVYFQGGVFRVGGLFSLGEYFSGGQIHMSVFYAQCIFRPVYSGRVFFSCGYIPEGILYGVFSTGSIFWEGVH